MSFRVHARPLTPTSPPDPSKDLSLYAPAYVLSVPSSPVGERETRAANTKVQTPELPESLRGPCSQKGFRTRPDALPSAASTSEARLRPPAPLSSRPVSETPAR